VILKLDFEKAYDKVSWPFLLEVLERKQFPKKWIDWIHEVISGGRVGIKINGESGEKFSTYNGVRQGDPVSPPPFPLLFNLVVDALATMLEMAKLAGLIKGLLPDLIEGD
jgi:hypothetical protein